MFSRKLCLAKGKYDMITTYAQLHAVASRIKQIKNIPSGSEAAKELEILNNLMTEFTSGKQKPDLVNPPEQPKTKLRWI
jgi:hypothetical protein